MVSDIIIEKTLLSTTVNLFLKRLQVHVHKLILAGERLRSILPQNKLDFSVHVLVVDCLALFKVDASTDLE
jgi:hypothetical protein